MSGLHLLCDLIEGTVTQTQREDRLSANKSCPPTCPFVDSLSHAESQHTFSQKSTSFSIPHTSRLQMSPWSFRRDFSKTSSTCQHPPYPSFLHEHRGTAYCPSALALSWHRKLLVNCHSKLGFTSRIYSVSSSWQVLNK